VAVTAPLIAPVTPLVSRASDHTKIIDIDADDPGTLAALLAEADR